MGGQRAIVLRLLEGPIMFCSFANDPMTIPCKSPVTSSGSSRAVTGLYCALSSNEGDSWSARRLVSDDGAGTLLESLDGQIFVMGFATAEPKGYLSARQSLKTNLIHLISSRQHYRFNLAWLQAPAPCTIAD